MAGFGKFATPWAEVGLASTAWVVDECAAASADFCFSAKAWCIASRAEGKSSNPSLLSSMLEEPVGLKGKPPVTSPKSLLGLAAAGPEGAAGAAIAPMAKSAREMYETCIFIGIVTLVLGINEGIDGQRGK